MLNWYIDDMQLGLLILFWKFGALRDSGETRGADSTGLRYKITIYEYSDGIIRNLIPYFYGQTYGLKFPKCFISVEVSNILFVGFEYL